MVGPDRLKEDDIFSMGSGVVSWRGIVMVNSLVRGDQMEPFGNAGLDWTQG